MGTRFYLLSATETATGLPATAQTTQTIHDNFEADQSVTRQMRTAIGAGQTSLANNSIATTSARTYYVARWASAALPTVDLPAGTYRVNFAAKQSNTNANFPTQTPLRQFIRVHAYVWRPTTSTAVGDVFDTFTNSDFAAISTAGDERVMDGTFAGAAVTGVQDGDVLILELMTDTQQGMSQAYVQTVYFSGTVETLTDDTLVSDHAAFIELPLTLPQVFTTVASDGLVLMDRRVAEMSWLRTDTPWLSDSATVLHFHIIGFRIWYDDNSVVAWPPGERADVWNAARSDGVQFVRVYLSRTYLIEKSGDVATEYYCADFHTTRGGIVGPTRVIRQDVQVDYYWYDATTYEFGAGTVADVPTGLPAGGAKTGSLLTDAAFYPIYNAAREQRGAP